MKASSGLKNDTLKVGFPFTWGNLTPALQHTAYADVIIKNQFEAPVRAGTGGRIEPLAARSWKISPDFKTFSFEIDDDRKFSDGTTLKPKHFKDAWEHALALQPKSANSSLQDLLYQVEGFENFSETKTLSGLIAKGNILEIRFATPFRMALDRLCGGRFGVYIVKGDKYLGTGAYVIEDFGANRLLLAANPFRQVSPAFGKVEIALIDPSKASEAITSGQIDVYASADAAEIDPKVIPNISLLTGDEVAHRKLNVNGMEGRFFHNRKFRLALQSLIMRDLPKAKKPKRFELNGLRWDPQTFLPLQAGRLKEKEVEELIYRGVPYIEAMIKSTHANPVYFVAREEKDWLFELLRSAGMEFSPTSGARDFKTLLEMAYKTQEPDLLVLGSSVASGDPDGVYHFLGTHGAILSPMTVRKPVASLLESGRAITEISKLDPHYQNLARAILEEVPYVHLGFDVDMLAYRSDRVKISDKVRNRKQFHFEMFESR